MRPPLDLTRAFAELGKLAMEDGDLGYAYWSAVIDLLKCAENQQAEIDRLRAELQRCNWPK